MKLFGNKKQKEVVAPVVVPTPTEKYVITDAKLAMDKLSEVSGGKNFQYDIYPFPGQDYHKENNFLVIKEGDTWFLRICQ